LRRGGLVVAVPKVWCSTAAEGELLQIVKACCPLDVGHWFGGGVPRPFKNLAAG